MKERGPRQRKSQNSFYINYEEPMMLGRDQSPPTAILRYRLQHGPRSCPPMIYPTVGDALSTCRRSKLSQTIQDSLSAEHLVQCSAHQHTLELHWEAASCGPPEAGPSSVLACPHGLSVLWGAPLLCRVHQRLHSFQQVTISSELASEDSEQVLARVRRRPGQGRL